MVSLVNNYNYFESKYPGAGSHGLTTKEEIVSSPQVSTKSTSPIFSITYYKPRKKGDEITMTVDFNSTKHQKPPSSLSFSPQLLSLRFPPLPTLTSTETSSANVSFMVKHANGKEEQVGFKEIPTKYANCDWFALLSLCSLVMCAINEPTY